MILAHRMSWILFKDIFSISNGLLIFLIQSDRAIFNIWVFRNYFQNFMTLDVDMVDSCTTKVFRAPHLSSETC